MLIIFWIFVSIIIFSIIIIIHELWHFLTARYFWVRVEEFWLGIPPKAKKLWTDSYGTEFTLNYLPIWWFCRLKWENTIPFWVFDAERKKLNDDDILKYINNKKNIYFKDKTKIDSKIIEQLYEALKSNNDSDSLQNKKPWQQSIIMLGWVIMNFLLAIVIFSILFMVWVKPLWVNTIIDTNISSKIIPNLEQAKNIWLITSNPWVFLIPTKDSIAIESWIKDYDLVLKVNWVDIVDTTTLKDTIRSSPNTKLDLLIERTTDDCDIITSRDCNFENINISIIPSNEWKVWAYLVSNEKINSDFKFKYWVFSSIKYGTLETISQTELTFRWLGIIIKKIVRPKTPTERQEALEQISGPIGMVDFMSKSISLWVVFLAVISATISISLWIFNVLPIPALDWWRFFIIFINSVFELLFKRKPIPSNIEAILHIVAFFILILLSVIIGYNDVLKIIN